MSRLRRREFLRYGGAALGSAMYPGLSAAAAGQEPRLDQGLQIGDVSGSGAVIWSRSDRPAQMHVEYDFREDFRNAVSLAGPAGPHALPVTDLTARLDLRELPEDRNVFVRVWFRDLTNERVLSEPATGRFRTPPSGTRDLRFVWGGDTAGQGWGINPEFGGMRIYESMRKVNPDFFIHCGDTIYADGPIQAEQHAEDGRTWKNIVTPEVAKVAETLDEFRGRYRYNLLDENIRRFNAEVPQVWLWDDHEVVNNWSYGKDLTHDDRFNEKEVPLLIARGGRAFREYAPYRPFSSQDSERIYRRIAYGELLDVFVLDMRSYRGPNSFNRQTESGPETRFLGDEQVEWLKQSLAQSKATWKVVAADMPIGLRVKDGDDSEGRPRFENLANGDGPPLGRELEMADLLSHIRAAKIDNVIWLTADVHYCAAHHYDPVRAQFTDFSPFWEFVAGPLNAGSFGPGTLDNTFGPEVVFHKAPPVQNASPFAGHQFFGQVDIDATTKALTVALKDIDGTSVFMQELEARDAAPLADL